MKKSLKKLVVLMCFMVLFIIPISTINVEAASIVPPANKLETIYATVNVTSGTLNARSGPGTNYSIVSSLKKGVTVKIVGGDGNYGNPSCWLYITSPCTGWVKSDYLTKFRTNP